MAKPARALAVLLALAAILMLPAPGTQAAPAAPGFPWLGRAILPAAEGVFIKAGYAAEAPPQDRAQIEYAAKKLADAARDWFSGSRLFFAIVPDKWYWLAEPPLPRTEPGDVAAILAAALPEAKYIDISELLRLSHYYSTDSHWDQRYLMPVAEALADAMGLGVRLYPEDGLTVRERAPYRGLYSRKYGLPLMPDTIYTLHCAAIDAAHMDGPALPAPMPLYWEEKLESLDPYSVYTGGVHSVVTIYSPLAKTNRELVVFRDSFASSLAPLLALGYSKITLIDLRFVPEKLLGKYIEPSGQDVLFLYSTLMLGSGAQLK